MTACTPPPSSGLSEACNGSDGATAELGVPSTVTQAQRAVLVQEWQYPYDELRWVDLGRQGVTPGMRDPQTFGKLRSATPATVAGYHGGVASNDAAAMQEVLSRV